MKKNLKLQIAILTLAIYVAANSVVSGTIVFMQQDFGISITNAESLITISSITSILSIIFCERITRRIGMKKCVMVGLFLVGLSSIFPIIRKSYASIFISRLILGLGIGLFNGHSANYINVFYEGDEASRLHGLRSSAEFIGQIGLLFVAGLLIKINWAYAFLAYFFAFFIMIIFYFKVPEVDMAEIDDSKFRLNKQIFLYVFFAAVMIMNVVGISVRFPTIATLAKGMDVDVNLYMMVLPISGMISGFMFGYINRSLREKTIILGLIIYIIVNIILAIWGYNMYIYLICMVVLAFAQSLCTPYLFAEISRFVRGSKARIANNLIFVGCNVGGFLAPFFLSGINKLLNSNSLTIAFAAFSIIYAFLLILNIYELSKIRQSKGAVAN